jgi:DNA-binding transcriptional MerR regulator
MKKDRHAMKNVYLLKDLSKMSGYSTHTLKFYLRLGLFKEMGRSPSTRFRYFDDSHVAKLRTIKRLTQEGVSLQAIKKHLKDGRRNTHE